ncbi:MAG: ATP-binding protein [Proteobacteria bacterium]|nr:ATP-binding protein [Pseudomonadota bacterium]
MSHPATSRATSLTPQQPQLAGARRIAHVVSVTGAKAVAVVERSTAGTDRRPERIEIGAVTKIATPRSVVIGLVSSVSSAMPETAESQQDLELVELSLAGEITVGWDDRLAFARGVANIPTVGDPVFMADSADLKLVYMQSTQAAVEIGVLHQDATIPARLLVDELLGKHFIVVGTTGCGKSSALTVILQSILAEYRHARMVILDIHDEYQQAFGDKAALLDTNNLQLPFWLLNFQELSKALASTEDTRDTEIEILGEAVLMAKRRYSEAQAGRLRKAPDNAGITVDTPTPFRLSDVVAYIDEHLGRLERVRSTLPYRRLISRIEAFIADPRYGFMFGSLVIEDTMADTLGRIFRIPAGGQPITVINLASIPAEILDVVISLLSRLAFDLAVWSQGAVPLLLVCEEAHRYAPIGHDEVFMPTRQSLSRIAKEGRKYGVSLALITQRPSELDPTILSQCSTVIAMRLSTERDQEVVRANTHEGAFDMLDFLPLLADREAIILGQGAVMPMRVKFKNVGAGKPSSTLHAGFSSAWKNRHFDVEHLGEVVKNWRLSTKSKTSA